MNPNGSAPVDATSLASFSVAQREDVMSLVKTYFFKNKIFRPGEIARAIKQVFSRFEGEADQISLHLRKELKDGTIEDLENVRFSSFDSICDIGAEQVELAAYLYKREHLLNTLVISFSIDSIQGYIRVFVRSEDSEVITEGADIFIRELALEATEEPLSQDKWEGIESSLSKLNERVVTIESAVESLKAVVTRNEKKLRCFLSYRFAPEIEMYAVRIQRFFNLLNVEVITGNSYEPQPISGKVVSRLSQSIDFVVLIIAASGESMWTRDEIAFSRGRGIPVIPLVEVGATFAQGLFGDQEYVSFSSGHIGDTFIQLLEAVTFLRAKRGDRNDVA